MQSLYPEIEPFSSQRFKADGHEIYFEQSGKPDGIPVVFLHGGPGGGSNANHRRYFDPDKYHIINFDQRGCNRSRPNGLTDSNTTWKLLEDLEHIRATLNIGKWLLFGGSWGATLALLYAQHHSANVSGIILRGTFLARKWDLDWFINDGANHVFPEYWKEFVDVIPVDERGDLVSAYHARVHGSDKGEREKAAMAWSIWAGRIVTYLLKGVNPDSYRPDNVEQTVNEVLIETHYAKEKYFIEENQILENVHRLPDVPIHIIHGRRDLTCLVEASWLLKQSLPKAELVIVREGGHLAGEEPMVDALVTATDKMARIIK